jgi:hypothetical protein
MTLTQIGKIENNYGLSATSHHYPMIISGSEEGDRVMISSLINKKKMYDINVPRPWTTITYTTYIDDRIYVGNADGWVHSWSVDNNTKAESHKLSGEIISIVKLFDDIWVATFHGLYKNWTLVKECDNIIDLQVDSKRLLIHYDDHIKFGDSITNVKVESVFIKDFRLYMMSESGIGWANLKTGERSSKSINRDLGKILSVEDGQILTIADDNMTVYYEDSLKIIEKKSDDSIIGAGFNPAKTVYYTVDITTIRLYERT